MKTIEKKKKIFFLSKWGYFEGNLFFSFQLCHLFFSDGDDFLFPSGSSLVCFVCFVPPGPRAAWLDSGSEGIVGLALGVQLLAGSLRRPG